MKRIGMIGGLSWASTQTYYRLLNEGVQQRLGGVHSARILLTSVDFAEIEQLQMRGEWAAAGQCLREEANRLVAGGADFLILATNTMHKTWAAITTDLAIPALHIAQATGQALQRAGIKTVGLLGTRFTMEEDFYRGVLSEHFGLTVQIPPAPAREEIHRIIYEELCKNRIDQRSKAFYLQTIADLAQTGCEAAILGCTEIGLLVQPGSAALPVFDTTILHTQAALDWALSSA